MAGNVISDLKRFTELDRLARLNDLERLYQPLDGHLGETTGRVEADAQSGGEEGRPQPVLDRQLRVPVHSQDGHVAALPPHEEGVVRRDAGVAAVRRREPEADPLELGVFPGFARKP